MLKSQIKKTIQTRLTVARHALAFPANDEGFELLLAYLKSQLGRDALATLVLEIEENSTSSSYEWDITYRLFDEDRISIKERLFCLNEVNGCVIIPTGLPRALRRYIRMDICDGNVVFELYGELTRQQFADLPPQVLNLLIQHHRKTSTDQRWLKERDEVLGLQRAMGQTVLSSPHLVRQPTYAEEAPRSPTRLYGEPVGRAEGVNWAENISNLGHLDLTAFDQENHKAALADIMGDPKPGLKVVDKNGWKGVYGYDASLPDLSEPVPSELPDAVVSPKYKEAFEEEVKKLKEKYPDISEEQIRNDLVNMTKE